MCKMKIKTKKKMKKKILVFGGDGGGGVISMSFDLTDNVFLSHDGGVNDIVVAVVVVVHGFFLFLCGCCCVGSSSYLFFMFCTLFVRLTELINSIPKRAEKLLKG